jgi:hypothetical protein
MTALPAPENWRNRPYLAMFGIAMFIALAVYSVAQTVTAVNRADYVAATITGGFAVLSSGAVLAIAASKLRSRTLRGVSDSSGTTLRPDPVAIWVLGVAFVGAMVSSAFYVVFDLRGEVDLPFTTPGREGRSFSLMSALLVISTMGLIGLMMRGRSMHLRLAPHGFEYADIMRTRSGSWDDVANVSDEARRERAYHPITFVLKESKPVLVHNASGYGPSGAAVYWMVRHYWKHPEDRAELTDGRALERLRNEDFDPE